MLQENITKNMKNRKTRQLNVGCDIKEQVLKAYAFRNKITFKRKSGMSKLLSINILMGLLHFQKF